MIPDLLADFGGALQQELAVNIAFGTLHVLRSAIHQNQTFLSRHPTSLFQVIHNALSWRADESRTKFFRATPSGQTPQSLRSPELQSLLRRWTRQKLEVTGPFTIAASLRPSQISGGAAQSIGSFDSAILSLYFTPTPSALIAVTSRDVADAIREGKSVRGEIGLFDPESGVELFPPLEAGSTLTATGLSPDSRTLVLGDSKGQVYVIDVFDRDVLHKFDSGHGIVGRRKIKVVPICETKGLDFSDWSNPKLISSEHALVHDREIRGGPWSADYAEDYEREDTGILHVVWQPEGQWFGTVARDGALRIWSMLTLELERTLQIGDQPENSGRFVDGIAIDRAGRLFCCKGSDLCVLNVESGLVLKHLRLDESTGFPAKSGFRLSHDETYLAIAGSGSRVTLWDTKELRQIWASSDSVRRQYTSAAFSPDDQSVFIGTHGGDVIVVETATGRTVTETNSAVGASIKAMAFSADGKLALGAGDGQVRLVDRDWFVSAAQLKGHQSHINALAVVPRFGKVITASDDRTAMLWDVANLNNPILLEGHSEGVGCVAATKELDIVATGGNDSQVILWRTKDGQRICHRRTGTNIGLSEVAFSPNHTWIAACGNRFAWVWFLEGEEANPFRTFHTDVDSVHQVVFDPSGEFLFALHSGSVIDGWRIRDGKQVLKDRLPWMETHGWKQAQRPCYEWDSRFRLWKDRHDIAVWHETGIIGWWPGRGYRIEAVTPNRFVVWQGGSALEFVEIREFGWE